ncbi:MAG: hypothetical protein CSA54_04520 [Gammaproteobacteria bacterium]|nr:MAG: hypothetical protein CSA54_04520 [Gammaproteobacteria bacterium]
MRPNDKDILSRLMDGEWGDVNPSQCLAGICASSELRERWARYHLARDAMRAEGVDERFSIADSVRAAIAEEETYSNVARIGTEFDTKLVTQSPTAVPLSPATAGRGLPWRQGAAGFALAASVAAATVIGVNLFDSGNPGAGATVASAAGDVTLEQTDGAETLAAAATATDSTAVDEPAPEAGNDASAPSVQLAGAGVQTTRQATLPEVDYVSNNDASWVAVDAVAPVPADAVLDTLYDLHIEAIPEAR